MHLGFQLGDLFVVALDGLFVVGLDAAVVLVDAGRDVQCAIQIVTIQPVVGGGKGAVTEDAIGEPAVDTGLEEDFFAGLTTDDGTVEGAKIAFGLHGGHRGSPLGWICDV
jgi:hypothetical protein